MYRRLEEYRGQQQVELDSLREVFQQQQCSFEHDLAEANARLTEVNAHLIEANAHIVRLDEEIRQKAHEIRRLCQDLDEKNQCIDRQRTGFENMELTAARLQDRVDALESSTSWRITRPIRRLRMMFGKTRQEPGPD